MQLVRGNGQGVHCTCKEEKDGEVPWVLHLYTAERSSSFGELALMNNKPLQASVRAVTSGTLWALKREDFRGILRSEFSKFLQAHPADFSTTKLQEMIRLMREAFSCCLLVLYLVTTCSSKWSSMSTAIQHFDAIRKR
ncbi:unnamed protein product [Camellia sinensis]